MGTPFEPSFTIGIEEEYFLVHKENGSLVHRPSADFWNECHKAFGKNVSREFLCPQIEVKTEKCQTPGQLRDDLSRLRKNLIALASKHGYALLAASTHPFGDWREEYQTTDRDYPEYNDVGKGLQTAVRRLLVCGMHVHVGIEDRNLRIELMNQLVYFLPHLLALSTSSPFWIKENTGLKSYRMSALGGLPNAGIPPHFESANEYEELLGTLISSTLLRRKSELWWDIRPSDHLPTIEMRVTDVCTNVNDGLAIAAIFRCLCRMLWRLRMRNQTWRSYSRVLINENLWLAQRYGCQRGLVDLGKGTVVGYTNLLNEILDLIDDDANYFGCNREVADARTIIGRGTSADTQLEIHNSSHKESDTDKLHEVVNALISRTHPQ